MPKSAPRVPPPAITFSGACDHLAFALHGSVRGKILDALMDGGEASVAFARLRTAMRTHTFSTTSAPLALRRMVDQLDTRTRREGLHVLEAWDYQERRFPDDTAPVLLLDYCERLGVPALRERAALAILLDQYLLSVLALVAVRAWDDGDANANLDRVSRLLDDLHGPSGSGHRVVENVETLLMLAIAHYNPEEASFDLLLRKVLTLDEPHRLRVALPCAGIIGGHLRWGLHFMYGRDAGAMRADNVVDYPWLLFALLTIARAYTRLSDDGVQGAERENVVEGLLNGLSADPWAFLGKLPAFLESFRLEHDELRELLARHGGELTNDFARLEPTTRTFSPLGFACNFLSNAAVASVVSALGDERRMPPLNALLSHNHPRTAPEISAEEFARLLMEFSAADPDRLGARGAPLIVYDPYDAIHYFNTAVRTLRDQPRTI